MICADMTDHECKTAVCARHILATMGENMFHANRLVSIKS
jgi:hypothetical protein